MPAPLLIGFLDTSALFGRADRHQLVDVGAKYVPETGFPGVRLCWSPWVVGELYRVLTCDCVLNRGWDKERVHKAANEMMRAMTPWVRTSDPAWPFDDIAALHDPDDLPIWRAAAHAKAAFLVTRDFAHAPKPNKVGQRLWAPTPRRPIRFVDPDEFVEIAERFMSPYKD